MPAHKQKIQEMWTGCNMLLSPISQMRPVTT